MKLRKFTSLLLSFALLATLLPPSARAAEEQTERTVWLHAQGPAPAATTNITTAYLSDAVDVYFAIDDPNCGAFDGTTHSEAWNDLNGYTVKVWYDPYYLQPVTTGGGRLDYTVPTGAYGSGDYSGDFDDVGYYVYRYGTGAAVIGGRSYSSAYVTVFFSGFWLPQKAEDALWYNLAKLPLKAVHTGSTDVWIETDEAIDPVSVTDALELFAKNESGEYEPTFHWTAVNGGYHHINIVEKVKPAPPAATPIPGSYTAAQTVTLDAEDDCTVYYSIDGGPYTKYTVPLTILRTQTVSTYALRDADGKQSNTVTYAYHVIPEAPQLFMDGTDGKEPIENAHYEDNPFTVYAAIGDSYAKIPDDSTVYYTFSETLSPAAIADNTGTDPQTQWVPVERATPKVGDNSADTITAAHTVRLVTVLGDEHSDVNWYYLGVQPAPVTFTPEAGVYEQVSVTVGMASDTDGAEIRYTTDGSDPRTSDTAQTYDPLAPPVFAQDVSIRAAARYDGVWSAVTSTWYVLTVHDDYGVSAFYPPGVYEGTVPVTLTPENPDYTIRYSPNGTDWYDYTEALTIAEDTDLYAKTVDPDGTEGPVYGPFRYTIRPDPPVFAPESTQFTNSEEITVFCGSDRTDANGDDFLLFYTTDGSDPTDSTTRVQADAVSDAAVLTIPGYTVVRAAVQRDGVWSSVVTHAYDVVSGKAVAPLTTLTPGYYTLQPGQEPYTTQFVPVPSGTTIYYTTDGTMPDANDPAQAYVPGTELPVDGHTLIRAVAVDALGYKSDVVIFDYTVAPAAPVAAPSAVLGGDTLPLVPVTAVEDATVTYTVNDVEWSFDNTGDTLFYLDTSTGIAYRDPEATQPLVDPDTAQDFDDRATVTLSAELDDVESGTNSYVYQANGEDATLSPPWADHETGTYEERALDAQGTLLRVSLDHLNAAGKVRYRLNNGDWQDYDGAIPLYYKLSGGAPTADSPITDGGVTVLQARVENGTDASKTASYVYSFVPAPPDISLPSGRYSFSVNEDGARVYPSTTLSLAEDAPKGDGLYDVYYRANGDSMDFRYTGAKRSIDHTMSFRAYTHNNVTGKISENTVHYYIIESPTAASGTVYTVYPFEVINGDTLDVAAHLLDDAPYHEGIRLRTQATDVDIRYFYTWTSVTDGKKYTTSTLTYDPAMPVFVNNNMSEVVINAWLEDGSGAKVDGSDAVFTYHFVDLKVPKTSLGESKEVAKGTQYTLLDDYPDNPDIYLYYTLDGTDPRTSDTRVLYQGEKLTVNGTTRVRAVYEHVCGRCAACKDDRPTECLNAALGEVGSYLYTIPGGGGGGEAPTLYTLVWLNQDGSAVLEKTENVPNGSAPFYSGTTPTKPAGTQYSYVFDGWATAPGQESGTPVNSLPPVSASTSYYAAFRKTLNRYPATWLSDDGTPLSVTEGVEYGTQPTYTGVTPTKPDSEHYTYEFDGWATSPNQEYGTDADSLPAVTGPVTYYAAFTPLPKDHTVTWLNYDGSPLGEDSVTYGSTPAYDGDTPTRAADGDSSYAFAGWRSGTMTYTATLPPVKGDVTFTAVYHESRETKVLPDAPAPYRYSAEIDVTDEEDATLKSVSAAIVAEDRGGTADGAQEDKTHVAAGVSTASAAAVVRAAAERGVGKPKLTDLTDAFLNAYGEELTDAAARNAAVTSYAADSRVYFRSALTSYRLASLGADVRAYELTYDVTPRIDTEITQNGAQSDATQKIANASVQNPMTIQLPVPDLFATTRVLVYHDGTKLDGDYAVQGEAGSRYVEVESSSFSSFTITALYCVTWKSQDGSRTLAVTEDLPYGAVPSYGGSTPTREADAQYRYSFAGWASTTAQTSGTAASSLPGVTEDATYYAAFTPTTRSYTITWKNHDGTVIKTTDALYGSTPLYDGSTPVRADPSGEYTYSFSGWTPALSAVTGDATYTACFDQHLTGYELTLSDMGAVYDGTAKRPAVTVEKDGVTLSPDAYTLSYDNNVNAGVNTAVVTVTLDGGKTITETFTIARRTLTVSTDDKTVTYGDAAPAYDLWYNGFAPGESAANLSVAPKAHCPYAPYDAAGEYAITPGGGVATNYVFVYEPGTLHVNRALSNAVTVALDDWVYGDAPGVPAATADFGRATTVYTYYTDPACTRTTTADDGAETDGAQPVNAGTYYVEARVPATADYVGGSAVDEFTIAKAPIAPTVSIQNWLVGTAPDAPTVDGNPGGGAVTIEYKPKGAPDADYTTTVPAAAETYTVRATVAETDNYQAGVATADFTIQLYQVVFVDYDGSELGRSGHNYGDLVSTVDVPKDPTRASEPVLDDDGLPVGTVTYTFAGWNPRVNGAARITKHMIYTATYTAYNSVTHDSTTVRGTSEIDVTDAVNAADNVVTTTETSTFTTTTTNGDTTELIRSTTVTTTETDNTGATVSEESNTKTAILVATNDERDTSVTPTQGTDAYLAPGADAATSANRVKAETVTTGSSIRSVTLDEVTANQILAGLLADNPTASYIRGEIYLQSTLLQYTLASEGDDVTAVKLVYDVKPFLRVTVDDVVHPSVRLPDSAIYSMTFRLPIPGNFSSLKYVQVVHDSDTPSVNAPETQRASVRQDTTTGQHHVELTVTHFSLFTITALYDITYNLAGGSADNPTSYTIESPDLTLNNPKRAGFSFGGWTGTGLTEATSPVTIPGGSAGDRVYTATWTPVASGGGGGGVVETVVVQYAVVLDPPVIGKLTSDTAFAPEGETVTIAADAPGRVPESVSVTDAQGKPVPVTTNEDGTFHFTMPASTVSVSVTFALTPAAPSISGVDRYLNTDDHILYIRGYPDGSVRPRGNISRAETAMMLYRLLKDQDVPITKSFRDVPKRAWYREAVLKLASLGIITGYRDGTFRPNEAIAREEFTTMVSRFAHATGGEIRFKDVRSGYWAEPYIRSAASYGWIQGYADANFCPKNPITRAEAAAVINRMLARSADLDYAAAHEDQLIHFTDLARNRWYYADMLEATNEHTHVYKDDKEHWTAITN